MFVVKMSAASGFTMFVGDARFSYEFTRTGLCIPTYEFEGEPSPSLRVNPFCKLPEVMSRDTWDWVRSPCGEITLLPLLLDINLRYSRLD